MGEAAKGSRRLGRRLRRFAKVVLSRDGPPTTIAPKYDLPGWLGDHNIKTVECGDVNSNEFIGFLEGLDPDLVLVAIYPQILGAVLRVPRLGVINYHPSSLPRYAGPRPIFWMLRNGEEEAGITIHEMVEKIDGGAILAQESLKIGPGEIAGQVLQLTQSPGGPSPGVNGGRHRERPSRGTPPESGRADLLREGRQEGSDPRLECTGLRDCQPPSGAPALGCVDGTARWSDDHNY